ncbi:MULTISPECIES: T9SS type A sorting domain-containing protein [Amniculibacterium]|uniref:T9SS type A sorting domain-containing protein n=1 Tax=Amniculibacterium TaxID=2715289 RepID=UPI000F59FEEA|nr:MULTISPECIES: T9SS type A sorting domain-containing protein [Amniculibacterium]
MKKNLLMLMFFGISLVFSGSLSAQYSREPLSLSQKSDDGVLVAYPNPAKDYILVKSKDASVRIKSVTFYSILGMQVASYGLNSNSAEINIEKLRPGKYLMRYTLSDDTQKVTQIIKQ